MDFGELYHDVKFVDKITRLDVAMKEINRQITKCIQFPYDKLTTEQKLKFDLYISYTMNSLYYIHIKLQGIDPNTHGVKNEIARVRQSMLREKQIREKKILRPTVDKEVAARFIKHGIHYRRKQTEQEEENKVEENSNVGRFVKLNQSNIEADDTGSFPNDKKNNIVQVVTDDGNDSQTDAPTAKKIKKNSNFIDVSDSNQKLIIKTKQKKDKYAIKKN